MRVSFRVGEQLTPPPRLAYVANSQLISFEFFTYYLHQPITTTNEFTHSSIRLSAAFEKKFHVSIACIIFQFFVLLDEGASSTSEESVIKMLAYRRVILFFSFYCHRPTIKFEE
jgi:hypothetical protein